MVCGGLGSVGLMAGLDDPRGLRARAGPGLLPAERDSGEIVLFACAGPFYPASFGADQDGPH